MRTCAFLHRSPLIPIMRLSRGLFFFVDEIFVRKFLGEGEVSPWLQPRPRSLSLSKGRVFRAPPLRGSDAASQRPAFSTKFFLPFSNFKFLYSSELNEAKALGVNVKLLGEKPLHTRLVHFYLIDIKYQKLNVI